MSQLNPAKLQINFTDSTTAYAPLTPRTYTLTHSDTTGDLFLTIGAQYHKPQLSGWYTRLMRDEVVAEWRDDDGLSLHVHCHVSGGLAFGTASWRDSTFQKHLPMVLEAFSYGDRDLFEIHPSLENAPIMVHFHSNQAKFDRVETWGRLKDYTTQQPVGSALRFSY